MILWVLFKISIQLLLDQAELERA